MSARFTDPARVCVLSGRFPRSEFLYSWNHYGYARTHGYTYIGCDWPTSARNRYYAKFMYLRHYLERFDYVFWLDDDAFFVKIDQGLEDFIPSGNNFISFCKSPSNKKIFTYLSSGQFLVRSCQESLDFVNVVLETPMSIVEDWWSEDFGMFTKGDQDTIVYLIHTDIRYKDCVKLFDYTAFNSRLADLLQNRDSVFLVHFTGPRDKKIADVFEAAKVLGTGPSLLPSSLEKELLGDRSRDSILSAMGPILSITKERRRGAIYKLLSKWRNR